MIESLLLRDVHCPQWKGIEATENLAKSADSKIVVIGNSKNGLPLILGQ